jgi:hypothetical protein
MAFPTALRVGVGAIVSVEPALTRPDHCGPRAETRGYILPLLTRLTARWRIALPGLRPSGGA